MIRNYKYIGPLVEKARKLYTEKTKQKCQDKFAPFKEDVLKLKAGITDEQLMDFKAKVEEKTGWKVVGIYLHQDEGHVHSKYIEGDENFQINYHAHVLYDCQDKETGKAIRLPRSYFRLRQDWLAAATGMERGNPASETGIKGRTAMEQRIHSQEHRIDELERIAREKERQHQEDLKRMAEEKRKAVEKAKKEATASVWHKVKDTFGADGTINDLKGQIKTLEGDLATEREKHKEELKNVLKSSKKPLISLMTRIASIVGWGTPMKDGYQEELVRRVQDLRDHERMWYRSAQESKQQLERLKQGQEQSHGIKLK